MLFDDFVLRQIQKIAELVAALAARSAGQPHAEVDAELAEAYRSLVGLERELAERMSAESLARLLGEPRQIGALALLMKAHGDLCAARGQGGAASALYEKALELVSHAGGDAELEGELRERLTGALASSDPQ